MYAGPSGLETTPGFPVAFPLYPAKDCRFRKLLDESDSPHEPRFLAPAEAGGGGRSAGRGKRPLGSPRTSPPGCSRCGKAFGSAGALGERCLTHGQKRQDVCGVCGKAFKRQDRLDGHGLTHQKIKPYACPERGCEKSYRDHRSLRWRYQQQHGAREAPQEGAGGGSPRLPAPYLRGGWKTGDRPTARPESAFFPPKRDLLRCVVNSFANRKLPAAASPSVATDSFPASRASCLASNGNGHADGVRQDRLSCQRNAASSDVGALLKPADASVIAPAQNGLTQLTGRSFLPAARLPSEPRGCPGSVLPPFPLFRGQKSPADPPSGDSRRTRNVPLGAKPRRTGVCLARSPPAAAQGVSQALAGPFRAFSAACAWPDASSFPAAPSRGREAALSESPLGCFEKTFRSAQPPDSHPWDGAGQLIFPEVPKRGAPWDETGPLFPKPQEPAACPRAAAPLPGVHLAPSPPVARPAAHPLQAPPLPQPTEGGGLAACLQKPVPPFRDVPSAFRSLGSEYLGSRAAHSQPRYAVPGCRTSGPSNRLENTAPAFKKEESKDHGGQAGGKAPAGAGRSWRLPAVRRERPTLRLSRAAPPSQVAMASFAAAVGPRRLTGVNRIQGGSTYGLATAARQESSAAGRPRFPFSGETGTAPADGSSSESDFLGENGGQPARTENGPESHACFCGDRWRSPRGKEERQVCRAGGASARTLRPEAAGDGSCPGKPQLPSRDVAASRPVIPVSVPVTAANSQVTGESPGAPDLRASWQQRKRKRRTRPKALFIPLPLGPAAQPGLGGCYRSHLRSPTFPADHLPRDGARSSPYTPPPMLSPVREGSGLYFGGTLCSSSADGDLGRLFDALIGGIDEDFGRRLMEDDTKLALQPRVNVGSQFQAELPDLQPRSHSENDDEMAVLVWKPWGDIETNPETQDRVTQLLNTACSSAMPAGRTNPELALHCLHEAQGNVVEALEMLLSGGIQKSETHPLADYHYTGLDTWTPLEQQLFQKAFRRHKKNFHLIQKEIQTKTVSQCVEYYYIWKKKVKFGHSRARGIEKKVKRDKDEVEEAEEKSVCGPRKQCRYLPRERRKKKRRGRTRLSRGAADPSPCQPPRCSNGAGDGVFPCGECGRVFDKLRGRNIHMKSHRPQEPLVRVRPPSERLQNRAKRKGTLALSFCTGKRRALAAE